MPVENGNFKPPTVIVTGFGPFQGHEINASWEAVRLLPNLANGDEINLLIEQLPVDYSYCSNRIPKLWNDLKPDLVVHVGVHGATKAICLEKFARNDKIQRPDVNGCVPETCCIDGGSECLGTGLDLNHLVVLTSNDPECPAEFVVSHDCGRYLCNYSYYLSLTNDPSRALFIHVPPLNVPYTAETLAAALLYVIKALLKGLKTKT